MLNFIDKLFSREEQQPDIFSTKYEEYLFKKYGKSDVFNKNVSLLIISDTHGTLNENSFRNYLKNKYYDVCIMLGDHYNRDIEIIVRNIDKSKLYGIKGNHDYDYLQDYDIPNINGQIININGIKILGMEGSFKYKPVDFPSFIHDESIAFLENKEKVDILVTHDKKFDPEKLRDPAHQGLIGITNYIYKNRVPIHIHGHIHKPYKKQWINGTTEYSVFGYETIKIGGNKDV